MYTSSFPEQALQLDQVNNTYLYKYTYSQLSATMAQLPISDS